MGMQLVGAAGYRRKSHRLPPSRRGRRGKKKIFAVSTNAHERRRLPSRRRLAGRKGKDLELFSRGIDRKERSSFLGGSSLRRLGEGPLPQSLPKKALFLGETKERKSSPCC